MISSNLLCLSSSLLSAFVADSLSTSLTRLSKASACFFRTCSLCSENAELMSFLRERVEPGGFGGQVRVKWVRGEEPELSVVGENMAQLAVYHVGKMGAPEVVQLLAEWGFSAREVPVEGVSGKSQAPGVRGGKVNPGAEEMLRGSGADGGEGDAPRLQALRSSLQAFPF